MKKHMHAKKRTRNLILGSTGFISVAVAFWGMMVSCAGKTTMSSSSLKPAILARLGGVDERYQSYNVEMAEVIGGKFWKPYDSLHPSPKTPITGNFRIGEDPSLFEARPPVDLANPRLRKLARALGPAYIRVSGTWANKVYFQNSEKALKKAPRGFEGVLYPHQWKGVVDFSRAVNAKIVTSFAISPGVRDAKGVWTPKQAQRFLAFNKSLG